ncbi:PREDICTED: (+)-neomenthol dehydrogenase-like [Ipomoea nil]|uniref:(+)-neomenthol dehydrogenase-like n=1 Tax=Ipomoea nil TaxID=35883 RepID=UPI000901FAA2|nr:PREDICTED: (+)-neomenthol dehydrogenase-like [Ipomoea nil]
MAGAINANDTSKRYAVVTGGNKGIGFEICRQLLGSGDGVTVVLTARDEQKGKEAVEKLRAFDFSHGDVLFHHLNVTDPSTVSTLFHFVKTNFGRLDILVNNAGVSGLDIDENVLKSSEGGQVHWSKALFHTYELTAECIEINYYGSKRMTEAFLPLLQLSKSPRIVNVSSAEAKLEKIHDEWAKGILNNVESPPEKLDEVVNKYLEDYKNGRLEHTERFRVPSAYSVSKATMNAYARTIAHKYPCLQVNCVNPGYVKTDLTYNSGLITVEEGAQSIVRVALQPEDGPSGVFFDRQEIISF